MDNKKERVLKQGKRYKHFKGKFYRVVGLYDSTNIPLDENMENYRKWATPVINALNNEPVEVYVTKWELKDVPYKIIIKDKQGHILQGIHVFYDALYPQNDYTMYIREYNNFMSLRDKEKYPQYSQEYRFEYADI